MESRNSGLSPTPIFFAIDSKPFGYSYSEWIAKYYKWIASIPENQNHPVFDKTGEKSTTYQTDPKVFFMPSAPTGYSIVRKCIIPQDKALLLCLLFSLCDEKVDKMLFSKDPVECVEDGLRDTKITLTVDDKLFDGNILPNIKNFKVGPLFLDVTYAENNYLLTRGDYVPGQQYKSIIGSYAIMLNPFKVGEHKVNYDVTSRGCTEGVPFHVNVEYLLKVI